MNPIDALFQRLRARRGKAFIPFVTAGDPSLEATLQIVPELVRRGANLVEVGFPYSDPIADGPVIQASYTRALDAGVRLDAILETIQKIAQSSVLAEGAVPLVGMVSYAVVHKRGPDAFLKAAQQAGLSGAIIPDLPVEESGDLRRRAGERDFKLIQLVTPTTPRDRAVQVARASTGFLYYVSVTGITGARSELPAELLDQLAWLRTQTDLPICVGFGISKPEQARMLRSVVDGIIVGSALVKYLQQLPGRPLPEVTHEMGELAGSLSAALEA